MISYTRAQRFGDLSKIPKPESTKQPARHGVLTPGADHVDGNNRQAPVKSYLIIPRGQEEPKKCACASLRRGPSSALCGGDRGSWWGWGWEWCWQDRGSPLVFCSSTAPARNRGHCLWATLRQASPTPARPPTPPPYQQQKHLQPASENSLSPGSLCRGSPPLPRLLLPGLWSFWSGTDASPQAHRKYRLS